TAVSTVIGRYYAMDRDKRWDRTRLAYDAMVRGSGAQVPDPITAIQQAYAAGETDEFVKPRVIAGAPLIREGDGIFCFNYRADRMRQIVRALAAPDFDGFDVKGRPTVRLATMTRYDETLPFPAAFEPIVLSRIVAEVLSERGKTMFRTAETEKYAHVTYFFNGGYEPPYKGEERLLVPSQKVATYDLMPEMTAPAAARWLASRRRAYDLKPARYSATAGDDRTRLEGEQVIKQAVERLGGWAVRGAMVMAVFLTVQPPNRLTAQVGHDPASSTYRDVLLHSGPMLFVGKLSGDRGRAGAGVSNAFTIGARYEIPA